MDDGLCSLPRLLHTVWVSTQSTIEIKERGMYQRPNEIESINSFSWYEALCLESGGKFQSHIFTAQGGWLVLVLFFPPTRDDKLDLRASVVFGFSL